MSAKNVKRTSSMYGSWLPSGSTPTKYGLRRSVKTWSLTRVAGTQAAMVGRSGFSSGAFRAANSSVQVLKPAAWHELVDVFLLRVARGGTSSGSAAGRNAA